LTQAPKGEALKQAEAEVERVTARYTGLRQNLKNAGFDEVQLAKSDEFMASFEAAVKDADNVGKAMRAAAVCGLRA
jgi:molybdopterin converting factor small subunit